MFEMLPPTWGTSGRQGEGGAQQITVILVICSLTIFHIMGITYTYNVQINFEESPENKTKVVQFIIICYGGAESRVYP